MQQTLSEREITAREALPRAREELVLTVLR
jgi:hypothetical protein